MREIVTGAALVALVAWSGSYLSGRPAATALDRWIFNLVPDSSNWYLTRVTWLRYPLVIVAGSVVLGLVTVRRDRTRALGCLLGPPIALLTGELVVKPAVGRTLGGALSFPSGSTVGAAALATALVLASTPRWRVVAVGVGAAYVAWMTIAVVALRWHFPTDVLAGLAYGTGVVMLVDGTLWWMARGLGLDARRRASPTTDAPPPRPAS